MAANHSATSLPTHVSCTASTTTSYTITFTTSSTTLSSLRLHCHYRHDHYATVAKCHLSLDFSLVCGQLSFVSASGLGTSVQLWSRPRVKAASAAHRAPGVAQ
ncbi:hypothetical protein E2C01_074261 [Portunus trituberculatus]|uniref:Uncharacterized protein n=1 Tax=Portunus trituberculatus TaxID=210409 RepID=A0A5B7ICV0_PORTR|nr:hypothetical protein [Portunus trituberculatus]